ncbi:hypothetical protein OG921_26210 [Aldersonia sp. NBC_00410]|uniref:hypothetical protein n=1 Tax=Aldersonia sp. NBC_00410 TaxID=2975954 RepID=UPI00225BC9C5|nr:hypothetical protein [Aldersonia sp. NBC_00410]MCX5046673.1 hypothetical protein [Aldersonia sp. NBC_00410]
MKRTHIVQGLLTAAVTVGIASGLAAGIASAEPMTGFIPKADCEAKAAELRAQHTPPPEQTSAGGYGYRCIASAAQPGKYLVERYHYNI